MDVIVHPYEGMDGNAMGGASFAQQATAVMAIFVIDEGGGAIDAALGDMGECRRVRVESDVARWDCKRWIGASMPMLSGRLDQ